MATGIVSVAARDARLRVLSLLLMWLAVGALAIVAGLAVLRAMRFRDRLARDLRDPALAFGAFTLVAGLDVVGTRLGLTGAPGAAAALGLAALVALLPLVAAVIGVVVRLGVGLRAGVPGNWLLATVAVESLAVIAAELAHVWAPNVLLDFAFGLWVLGLLLYVPTATLVVARLVRRRRHAAELRPDDWILMGALAISGLAAAELLAGAPRADLAHAVAPGVRGVGLAIWIAAGAWIPVLVALEARRARALGLSAGRFDAERWATVFPLGMYASMSHGIGHQLGLPALATVSDVFSAIAAVAWLMVGAGLVRAIARTARAL